MKFLAQMFDIEGRFLSAVPYGNGHINDTFLATYASPGGHRKFIYQRINRQIFPDPIALMTNFERVTEHIKIRLQEDGIEDIERRVLTPVKTSSGKSFTVDDEGEIWRTTPFIDGSKRYDLVSDHEVAFEVGRSYGEFQTQLLTLAPDNLKTTIADFHNTRKRFDRLQEAIERDSCDRAVEAKSEIAFAECRESYVNKLDDLHNQGLIPVRIVHNDTKVNNLLFDIQTGKGICVTDLDTTMPGLILHDFGDMVRTVTNSAAEDETNLNLVKMRLDLFEPLARGYISEAGQFFTSDERNELVFSSKVMVLETGIRFLTDFLQGDRYFKIQHEGHNLDRCRTQFRLLESIEEQEESMEIIVSSIEGLPGFGIAGRSSA